MYFKKNIIELVKIRDSYKVYTRNKPKLIAAVTRLSRGAVYTFEYLISVEINWDISLIRETQSHVLQFFYYHKVIN